MKQKTFLNTSAPETHTQTEPIELEDESTQPFVLREESEESALDSIPPLPEGLGAETVVRYHNHLQSDPIEPNNLDL